MGEEEEGREGSDLYLFSSEMCSIRNDGDDNFDSEDVEYELMMSMTKSSDTYCSLSLIPKDLNSFGLNLS